MRDLGNSRVTPDHLAEHPIPLEVLKSVPFAGMGNPLRSMARSLALQILRDLLREITAKGGPVAVGPGIEKSAGPNLAAVAIASKKILQTMNLQLSTSATQYSQTSLLERRSGLLGTGLGSVTGSPL